MSSEAKGAKEVMRAVSNFLKTEEDLVLPIVRGFNTLLAIAESDPIFNAKIRPRLADRAKEIEDEMEGMMKSLKGAKEFFGGPIVTHTFACCQELKSLAGFVNSACKQGNFQALKWSSSLEMYRYIYSKGDHVMNTLDNGFNRAVPDYAKSDLMKYIHRNTNNWRIEAKKGLHRFEQRAA